MFSPELFLNKMSDNFVIRQLAEYLMDHNISLKNEVFVVFFTHLCFLEYLL